MIKAFALSAALSAASCLPALAEDLSSAAQIDVLPGWRTAEGTHMAALRIRLAPGWKTYWRAPGEAGIPPRFELDGSDNIRAVTLHWPTPHVFEQNGMRSIGYKGELILPMEFTADDAGQPITVNSEIELGVCLDICMPLSVRLRAELPAGGQADPAIRAALADQPVPGAKAGVTGVKCDAEPISDGLRLTASLDMAPLGRDEVTVIELSDQTIWISEAETARSGQRLTASSDLVPSNAAPFMLDRSDVRITVLAEDRAVDIQGCAG